MTAFLLYAGHTAPLLPARRRCGRLCRSILVKGYEQTILAAFAADGRQLEAPHAAHCENICGVGGLVGGLNGRWLISTRPAAIYSAARVREVCSMAASTASARRDGTVASCRVRSRLSARRAGSASMHAVCTVQCPAPVSSAFMNSACRRGSPRKMCPHARGLPAGPPCSCAQGQGPESHRDNPGGSAAYPP